MTRRARKAPRRSTTRLSSGRRRAIQLIKALRYKAAAKPLVGVIMTRNKLGVALVAKSAIMVMPNEAEPFLAAALNGTDPDFVKLQVDWGDDKGYIPNLIDVLGYTALDSSRDTILSYIPKIDSDQTRAGAAKMLVWFTPTPALISTFKGVYAKLPPIASARDTGDTGLERSDLLSVASQFFDPSLGPWALGEAANAKGTIMLAAKAGALQSAIKLMGPTDKKAVEAALTNLDNSGLNAKEKQDAAQVHVIYKNASESLDKCGVDRHLLREDPRRSHRADAQRELEGDQGGAHGRHCYGNDATRKALIAHIPKVTNPGARLAMAVSINHLAPKGDTGDADALDKIVEGDTTRKDTEAMMGDDALSKVALMLRAAHGAVAVGMIRIEVESGQKRGTKVESSSEVLRIGRADGNDLLLPDDHVSGDHARLNLSGERWVLSRPSVDERNGARARRRAAHGRRRRAGAPRER